MKTIFKSLCWAAAIILVALGNAFGAIDDGTARTLFIVLPILMVLTLPVSACRRCTA